MHACRVLKVELRGGTRNENFVTTAVQILELSSSSLTSDLALGQDDNVVCQNIDLIQEVCRENDAALGALLQKDLPDNSA